LKRISILIILLIAILFFISQSLNVQAETKPSIKIEPQETKKLAVNDIFTINVTVENCINVYAVQVDLRFNPEVLNVTNILEGPFLPSHGTTMVLLNESRVDLDATPPLGQVYYVASLWGDVPGASGSGLLFTVTFQVLSEGSSLLQFMAYPGGGSEIGTYFMDPDTKEILPELVDGFYGTSFLFSPDLSKVNVGGNVSFSCQILGISQVLTVTLQHRKVGGEWMDLETKPTNASGFVSFLWTPTEAGVFEFKVYTLLENILVKSEIVSVSVEAVFDFMTYIYIGVAVFVILIVAVIFIYKRRKRAVSQKSEVPT
jgi:hypothetical protein